MIDMVNRRRLVRLAAGASALVGLAAACAPAAAPSPVAPTAAPPTAAPKPAATPAQPAATKPAATQPAAATAAPAKPVTMTKFILAINAKNFTSTPLWAADKAGVFKDAGIQLETPEFANGNLVVRTVLANEALSGLLSVQPIYASTAQGSDLVMVAAPALKTSFAIVARKDKNINTLEDLYGKTVGANGPGAGLENFVYTLFQAKGLDAKKINFVNIGETVQQWKALTADKVEAGVVISSEFSLLKQFPELKVLVKGWEELPLFNRFGMPVHRKDMAEKDELFKRFFVAFSKAYRWGLEHKAETVAVAMDQLQFAKDQAEAGFDDLIENQLMNPDLSFTEKHVEYMQQQNVDTNQQKEVLPFDKVADLRYVKVVLDTLGPYKYKS